MLSQMKMAAVVGSESGRKSGHAQDGTVRLLWVCPFSRPECGRGFAATNVDQRTPDTMLVVLAVVVVSVLLLLLPLVLV